MNPVSSTGQALPGYIPDFNADEAVWGWAREEATGNLCLETGPESPDLEVELRQ